MHLIQNFFNNTTERVVDDLKVTLKRNNKVAIASACFSIYAFQALKEQLQQIDEMRFLFTSPTFAVPEKVNKVTREFFIPKHGREQSLYGTEFEIRLRNELTQKAIARECAAWIRKKVQFRTNMTFGFINPFMTIDNQISYTPINEFTTVGLGAERGNVMTNFISKLDSSASKQLLNAFDSIWNDREKIKDVTNEVLDSITAAYRENPPELVYYLTLYAIFNEFLDDVNADAMPDDAVGFKQSKIWSMLYDFQKDAALSIIHKLERFNGCILADSVGLGKTFTALAVIKYYEKRNKNVLVLCPKKLTNNWNTYRANYKNNPLISDRFAYQVLFHSDLSRKRGTSNGIDLSLINWENYDLIVIDESHNFRNGGHSEEADDGSIKLNRYSILMENVIKKGVKTKVLMLSATPVNNRFTDLHNQLKLAYEGDSSNLDKELQIKHPIAEVFRNAQASFNDWYNLPPNERTIEELLKRLSVDFFTVLDAVTIARSRNHIRAYYNMDAIGKFPERQPPLNYSPELTDLTNAPTYDQIYETLEKLNLMVYVPTHFIHPSQIDNYADQNGFNDVNLNDFSDLDDIFDDSNTSGLTQLGREQGIRKIISIGLLKRLESSVYAFTKTLKVVLEYMRNVVDKIDAYENNPKIEGDGAFIGRKVQIRIEDMDWQTYRNSINDDIDYLQELLNKITLITPQHDLKLKKLNDIILNKLNHPLNNGNKKLLIFSAFTDTAEYLYQNISNAILKKHNLHSALITGDSGGSKTTLPKCPPDFNDILTCFSPRSKDKQLLFSNRDDPGEIDILFASDCISEGQNLQDCDMVVNYDIHWNPCRIIQRYGRVDRIGSVNAQIQLVNFWPNVSLDRYIQLRDRVEARMKIVNFTATGDDNPIAPDDPELEFRKRQPQRLKEEAIDLEDMHDGISIMDLGLSEFQQDLLAYVKAHPNTLEKLPHGINAVVEATESLPPGVIFVLRNINPAININQANRLHPYYLIYVNSDGQIKTHHTNPKNILDEFRKLAKGKTTFNSNLVNAFNQETHNGKNMQYCSELLGKAIASLVERQNQNAIDSLFSNTNVTTALENPIEGLDDFELVTFLVIRNHQ